MTRMLKISPGTDHKMKRLLSQKFNNVESNIKSTSFDDGYEVIEKKDCLPMGSPAQLHMPPRSFSLDSATPLKKFPNHSSVPEVTQSLKLFPKKETPSHSVGSGSCRGACGDSRDDKFRQWRTDSGDSGMGHSQDSCDSTESLSESCQEYHLHRKGFVWNEWKVSRAKLFNGIYSHKNASINKKVRISGGSCQRKQNVNLSLQLHPDGLGNDKGTYTTFVITLAGVSNPKSKLFLDLTLRVIDCQNQNIISLRNFHLDLSQKSHTFNEFLSHEVIKHSQAKKFHLLFKFQLLMAVKNEEWIVL